MVKNPKELEDLYEEEKLFDTSKWVMSSISSWLLYLVLYMIDIPLIDNVGVLAFITLLTVISYTILLVGVSVLLIHFYNEKLVDSEIMKKLVITRIVLIAVTVMFVVFALIDGYHSNICTGREKHFIEREGYFYDLKMVPVMLFSPHEEEEYKGTVIIEKRQDDSTGWRGNSVKDKPVYYLISPDSKILGVLSRSDLSKINLYQYVEYHVVYYPNLKVIKSIEPIEQDENM